MASDQPIATPPHRDAILGRMRDATLPVDRALRSGRLTVLDAFEILSAFMREGRPDPTRFRDTPGPVLADARLRSARTTVRAFGEMVDLLWSEGNADGALQLEHLWNDLADTHGFSLLCAYSMRNFSRESHALVLQSICAHHAHVIPTESYTQANDGARMVEIALLQQRALALESEIEHRKELIIDLLNFSRVDAGRVDYELKSLPLAPLVDEVVALLSPLLESRQLTRAASVDTGAGALVVRVDPGKVHQILVNLLTNAIKFTLVGGRITIACETTDDAIAIHVRDTAIGDPVHEAGIDLRAVRAARDATARSPRRRRTGPGDQQGARTRDGRATCALDQSRAKGRRFTLTVPRAS